MQFALHTHQVRTDTQMFFKKNFTSLENKQKTIPFLNWLDASADVLLDLAGVRMRLDWR